MNAIISLQTLNLGYQTRLEVNDEVYYFKTSISTNLFLVYYPEYTYFLDQNTFLGIVAMLFQVNKNIIVK